MNTSNSPCFPVISEESQRCNTLYFGPVYANSQVNILIDYVSHYGHILSIQKRCFAPHLQTNAFYLQILFVSSTVSTHLLARSPHHIGDHTFIATSDLSTLEECSILSNYVTDSMIEHSTTTPKCIHVKGIKSWMLYKELIAYFEEFGPLHQLKLFRGRRDYGFLSFKDNISYLRAISAKRVLFHGSTLVLTEARQSSTGSAANSFEVRPTDLYCNAEQEFGADQHGQASIMISNSDRTNGEDNYAEHFVANLEGESIEDSSSDYDEGDHQYRYSGSLDFSDNLTEREVDRYAKLLNIKDKTMIEISQVVKTTIRLRKNGIYYQKAFTDTNAWVYYPSI